MADTTFFELFTVTWAQSGSTEGITGAQYKTGWAYIGSLPPTVEQFNKVQQLTDEKLGWLFRSLAAVAALTGRPLSAGGDDAISYALQNLNAASLTSGIVPVARLAGTASSLTAGAATKLGASRSFSLEGGATAAAQAFDGTGDVKLTVTGLDVAKANAGVLAVARGGTGVGAVAAGDYLVGAGGGALATKTPVQVLNHIGGAPLDSPGLTGTPTAPTPGTGDNSQRLATTEFVSRILGSYPMMVSIVAVPTTNMGPIMIAEAGEMWLWTSTAYYTGYRSPLCGRPLIGHTPAPLVNEIDATGGLLSKAAYPALWGYAREAGLVVSQATWAANVGAYYFVDVNSTQFRVPDLRDMHFRYTGSNADGGARVLGTKQMDAGQRLQGVLGAPQEIGINGVFAALPGTATQFAASGTAAQAFSQVQMDTARASRVSSETRGINVAFNPRIHI
jgi:hypothetical protein